MDAAINLTERPQLKDVGRRRHFKGQEQYLLPSHWSLHIYDYHARLRVDQNTFELFPGALTLVPPNTLVEYQFEGPSVHLFAHFSLPQPIDECTLAIPIFHDVRSDYYRLDQTVATLGRSFLFNDHTLWAEIRLWDLLWELAANRAQEEKARHPSIEKALTLIELRLGEDIPIASLAREVGLSRNHLTRLFRQETGLTVVAYVRQQRARKAKHLLEHTTMPIKSVAAQVNAPNLQSFSALVRKETGSNPNFWRRRTKNELPGVFTGATTPVVASTLDCPKERQ